MGELLTKTTTVLKLDFASPRRSWFEQEEDGGTKRLHQMGVDREVWEEMDKPDEITVTIEPGDTMNNRPERIADRAEVFQSKISGQWYVRTVSDNGEIILSSEGYENREHAYNVAFDTGLPVEEVEVRIHV